jgi:rhodanese-related sulfurtransferase
MVILDVREKEEYEAEHIPGSIFCPLSQFDLHAKGILKNIKESDVIVMCRSGKRAKMALDELKKHDASHLNFTCFEGGILQWKSEGKPVVAQGKAPLPIMRQVQIGASSMIILAFAGSHFIAHDLVYLALFVGFGLALAGWTGICPMVSLLQKMPWNKKSGAVSTNASCCQ